MRPRVPPTELWELRRRNRLLEQENEMPRRAAAQNLSPPNLAAKRLDRSSGSWPPSGFHVAVVTCRVLKIDRQPTTAGGHKDRCTQAYRANADGPERTAWRILFSPHRVVEYVRQERQTRSGPCATIWLNATSHCREAPNQLSLTDITAVSLQWG